MDHVQSYMLIGFAGKTSSNPRTLSDFVFLLLHMIKFTFEHCGYSCDVHLKLLI